MASITVTAYFYSPKEKQLILQHITPIAETETSILGALSPASIGVLKQQKILIDLQQDPSITKSLSTHTFRSNIKGARSVQIQEQVPKELIPKIPSNLFLMELPGPLMDDWKKKLKDVGVEIKEFLEQNTYTVKTLNPQVLEQLTFVSAYRPYGIEDKNLIASKSALATNALFGLGEPRVATYDIRLRKGEDRASFMEFLKTIDCKVLAESTLKIRALLSSENDVLAIGSHPTVYGMEEYIAPQLFNNIARQIINIDPAKDRAFLPGHSFTGKGELIGIADTGIDDQHPDLKEQIKKLSAWGRTNNSSDPNGHGTHVAGSAVGNGSASDGEIKGVAPDAQLFFQSLLDENGGINGLPHDLYDLFMEAYEAGVRIHNNSWGSATESEYRFNSLEVDDFVYQHKDMLIVISAGNEGTALQPRNTATGFVDWLSLGSPATAKNALTVGASKSARMKGGFSMLTYGQAWPDKYPDLPINETLVSGDPEGMAGFSSRGPCGNESRIKPDVVAPGTDIASTRSSDAPSTNFWGPYPKNRHYAFLGGTSMATPIVTGFAALLREYLREKRNYSEPSAALLKAIIINSARTLKGADSLADHAYTPNFHQGFGCIDMLHILPSLQKKELGLHYLDTWKQKHLQLTSTGQRFLFRFRAQEGIPLRLCLTWTDPPGRGLQNNLNLLLMKVDDQFKWVGNHKVPRMITDFDRDNNVETILVEDTLSGEYRVVVQASNLLVGPQDFALCITGNIKNELEQIK